MKPHAHRGHGRRKPVEPDSKRPDAPRPQTPADPRQAETGTHWGGVAQWYDTLVGDAGSEYHQRVVFPGVVRLLGPAPGEAILDVACGQGALCRLMREKGAKVTGVDAAADLIAAAKERSLTGIEYQVMDARELSRLGERSFVSASCVLAIQNIDPVEPVFNGVARALRPGGRFVLVMMHPCFRQPKQSHWEWDEKQKAQYRRIDRYMTPMKSPIYIHPGADPGRKVWDFHRPLHHYISALGKAGLLIDRMEEWTSHKKSDPGPRAEAEDVARNEVPMFLALRCVNSGASIR